MSKSYNVNCPHPDGLGDQILLGDDEDANQTLEDAAAFALGIMADHWDRKDYDRANYSISWQGENEQK